MQSNFDQKESACSNFYSNCSCPYSCQVAALLTGLTLFVNGLLFFLISAGSDHKLWIILGGSCTATGLYSIGIAVVISCCTERCEIASRALPHDQALSCDTEMVTYSSDADLHFV